MSPKTDLSQTDSLQPPLNPKWLDIAREVLPWVMVIAQFIYNYGVKTSTSDRVLQQQLEDHVGLQQVRTEVGDLSQRESLLAGKLDMLITATYHNGGKDNGK